MESGSLTPAGGQFLHNLSATGGEHLRFGFPFPEPSPASESVLGEYFRILLKRRWVILGTLGLIFVAVAISSLRMTKVYEAKGSLAISRQELGVLGLKDQAEAGDYSDPTDLDTEVQVLQSDRLALLVIQQLNLDKRPEFGGSGDMPSNSIAVTTDMLQPDSARTSGLLGAFKGGLHVSLRENTRIIEVLYSSPNNTLAAAIVNSLMQNYVEQNFKMKFQSTMDTTEWLTRQLSDLKIKVETSQEKLVKYQKDHEILGIDEKQNLTTDKLAELNKELTLAESDRMEKEAIYRMVQSGDPASINGVDMGEIEGSGAASQVTLLSKLQAEESDLKIQVAQLSTQFGPAFPKVTQLNSQLKEVQDEIRAEMTKIVARSRGAYLTSLQREQMLREALDQQKQEANQLNENAIEFSDLKREVETYRQLYDGLMQKMKEANVTAGLRSNNIRIIDPARVPTSPSSPNIPRNLAFALSLGLTTGITLAFLLEALDNTVRTPEQAQAISGLPPLGLIPLGSKEGFLALSRPRLPVNTSREAIELVTLTRPQSQMAESFRALRTSLLLSSSGGPPRIIVITSSLPQEGKTTASLNTSLVLAQKGARVLLIDGDMRRPSIHKTLGMGPRSGLSNVLTGSVELKPSIVRSDLLPSLFVLPAGTPPPNPAELLASPKMKEILEQLVREYDHVVIDTPPALSVTDSVILSTAADSVVLVIRAGQTTKPALRRARDLLMRVNAKVSGVLLNGVDLTDPDYYHYYEYHSKDGQGYYVEGDEKLRLEERLEPDHEPTSRPSGTA
jgi:capsular exopolysaccharide synthesis family protein